VKVGSILTTKEGLKVKVIEYNPQYGVKIIRTDKYAGDKPSGYIKLTRFQGFEEVANKMETTDDKATELLNKLKKDVLK
jgi:hypothetical protein